MNPEEIETKAYELVSNAARDSDADKIVIVYNADGPVALAVDKDLPWITILSANDDGNINYLNVDNLYFAEQLVDVLQGFITSKKKEKEELIAR